ncbi:Nucleoporin nup82 [Choanephora cucurbitarum]|uniref:Nucleoporin nup82 n=1 Tax=Choanephora cucurbitarum TaxID=101091 RepID=A0A1C7NHK2_9FUNG|nr:Nucleoporin nup82 [Choanephora cucurbitarum]
MTVWSDTWLEHLVIHPIFSLTEAEKQYSLRLKNKQTRQQNDVVDFVLQHHTRVLTLRDNDLLLAVGSQIRALNLVAFKDAWLEASNTASEQGVELPDSWIHTVPYKTLITPDIDFTIHSLTPNNNGRLLAVTGENRLVVVCLPRQGFSNLSDQVAVKKVDCRTLSVGTQYYDRSKNAVVQVEWHPLSATRTHLVVLGDDSILRIFDVSVDISEPEQSFDLSPAIQKPKDQPKIGFSLDDDDNTDEDAVAFTLGNASTATSGWESFTIFYTLRSGHIYALCPVIPYRSVICRSHLDNLSCISDAKYEQAKSSSESDHKLLSHLFKLQNLWVNALFQSAKIARHATAQNSTKADNDMLTVTSSKNHSLHSVQRQGPFMISHTNILADGIEPSDILYINADTVHILALAFNNGLVHNYILGSEIDAQWQLPTSPNGKEWERELAKLLLDTEFLPKASLYETVQLRSQEINQLQSVRLLSDPMCQDIYFAYHATGVHAVVMSDWLDRLKQLSSFYEDGQDTEAKQGLASWLKQKKSSEVRLLVNSAPFQNSFVPVVGLTLITDMYLSYSLLTLTADYRLITQNLNIRREVIESEEVQNAVKAQLKSLADEDQDDKEHKDTSGGYQPALPLPAFQPPTQLDTLPKQPKIVIPSEMSGSKEIVINEDTLRFFAKSTEQIRRQARDLKKAASKVDTRLTVQQKEFERQVKTLRELYYKLQKINSEEAKAAQQQRLKEITKQHTQLRLRIDKQLRTLMKVYQPDLSNQEKEWITKLEELSKKISGDSGYLARIQSLQTQLEQLEIQKTKTYKSKSSNMNSAQLEGILRTLKQQQSTIEQVNARLKNLDIKMPVN